MGAIDVHTHSFLGFHISSFSNQPKLGKPIFSLRDHVPSPFERKDLRLTISCIGSDGTRRGRPPQRSSTSARKKTNKEHNNKNSPVAKNQPHSSSQEEIIALFRRIESSISEEEPVNDYKITSKASENNSSSAESILRVLRGSGKQGKTKNERGNKILTRRRGVPKKVQEIRGSPPVTDSNLTRPPSKFVKRSPIPSPTTPREKFLVLNNEIYSGAARTEESDLPNVEEMKLPDLKELAKSRGIRGYSKLKKSELVNLLRS